jgi:hypothetical protein
MKDESIKHIKRQSKKLDKAFKRNFGLNGSVELDKKLENQSKKNKKILDKELESYLVLFDDGLNLIIQIHEVCKSTHQENKSGISFLILSSKLITLLIGIRKMIYSGLPDCIKNLQRPFIETIDVFFACIINDKLNESFSSTNELYDNNDFYWKHFSKDKLPNEYKKLFEKLSITPEYIQFLIDRRKKQKSFLSESIHSSFNASFSNFIMTDLNFEFSESYWGKITSAYPMMLMDLIQDIYIFDQIFYKVLEQKINQSFRTIEISQLNPLYLHAHYKYEALYKDNWESLYKNAESYPKFLNDVIEEMKKQN